MAIDERVTKPRIETEIIPHLPDRSDKARTGFSLGPDLGVEHLKDRPDLPFDRSFEDNVEKCLA